MPFDFADTYPDVQAPVFRRRRRRVTLSERRRRELDAMWALYVDGATAKAVGEAFGRSKQAILQAFQTWGYERRACGLRFDPAARAARIHDALTRYNAGTPVPEIAQQMGISRNYAYELVRAGGRSPVKDRWARERASEP